MFIFCYRCSAEYIYFLDEKPFSISLYTTINDKMYRWTTYRHCKDSQLWYVKNPGIPGVRRNSGLEFIKAFNLDAPKITPDNISNKLPIYLLFL